MPLVLPGRIELNTFNPNARAATLVTYNPGDGTSLFMNWAIWGGALNDYVDFSVLVEAGTYTLTMIYIKMTDCGIITPSLDGVDLATLDTYGGTSRNTVATWSGITVGSAGMKTLRFKVTGKNAGSSNYYMKPHYISLQRTDAGAQVGKGVYEARHIDICPWMGWDAVNGYATVYRIQTSAALSGGYLLTGAAESDDGDSLSYYVALAAGTWTFTILYYQDAAGGKADVSLGGVNILSGANQIDYYTAATASNQVKEATGVSVATDGVYELKFTVNGKNASSVDFKQYLHWIVAQKTA